MIPNNRFQWMPPLKPSDNIEFDIISENNKTDSLFENSVFEGSKANLMPYFQIHSNYK